MKEGTRRRPCSSPSCRWSGQRWRGGDGGSGARCQWQIYLIARGTVDDAPHSKQSSNNNNDKRSGQRRLRATLCVCVCVYLLCVQLWINYNQGPARYKQRYKCICARIALRVCELCALHVCVCECVCAISVGPEQG